MAPDFWRRHRAECAAVFAIVLTFLFVSATFWSWSGLWASPGPRYVFVATPLLLLPLGGWLDRASGRGRWRALWATVLVGFLLELGITIAHWRTIVDVMDYRRWEPGMEFLFIPDQSPLLAAWRVIADGAVDTWLWTIAVGWTGHEGHPVAALVVLALWGVAFALCARRLAASITSAA
jgi:hypothetical protein